MRLVLASFGGDELQLATRQELRQGMGQRGRRRYVRHEACTTGAAPGQRAALGEGAELRVGWGPVLVG